MNILYFLSLLGIAAAAGGPYRGFNVGGNRNSDNGCKTTDDWKRDFERIKSWPGGWNAVRIYSTGSDNCQELDNAAAAAISTGLSVFIGIWSGGNQAAVDLQFSKFESVIKSRGTSWIAAVSVGSEDLYRKATAKEEFPGVDGLVTQINRAKNLLKGTGVQVTHVDTWTAWVDPGNSAVVDAVDFVTHNSFPYWEGAANDLDGTFFRALDATTEHAKGKPVWIGETGEPSGGAAQGDAKPSVERLQQYWHNVACNLEASKRNFFWFRDTDTPFGSSDVERSFGVADKDGKLKIKLEC